MACVGGERGGGGGGGSLGGPPGGGGLDGGNDGGGLGDGGGGKGGGGGEATTASEGLQKEFLRLLKAFLEACQRPFNTIRKALKSIQLVINRPFTRASNSL